MATNAEGQYLGSPELGTLFSVLNERQAVVILHPHRPEPVNRQVMQQTPLAMQEYLSETTRAVSNMISRNVLARYNKLKVIVPHVGAYLPLSVPRMKSLVPVMQANKLVGEIDWEKNLQTLYFDLAGAHSPEALRMLLTITSPDHLLYGSDYPMQSRSDSTQIRILEIYASEEAYQHHLGTEHFKRYKQGTQHMVKSLNLPTMQPLDPETMKLIFKKRR